MKFLWAPWRLDYILGPKEKECIFCQKPAENQDKKNLILHRGKHNFVMLNLYPYNNGHLMVVPYSHANNIADIKAEEAAEMMVLAQKSVAALGKKFNPHGYNVGMNIGASAGAGIDEHIHLHIVPRWDGDTNYMPVIGETKVMPQHIDKTYDLLAGIFADF